MKTSIFDFSRLLLLFRRYFAERKQTELIYWAIMILAFAFIRNWIPAIGVLIFVAGVFYAARFLREIHSPTNGVAYFMLPATQLEKITVAIVMTSFYYFAMMMLCYIVGNLLGTAFNNLMASVPLVSSGYMEMHEIFYHNPLKWVLFESTNGNWSINGGFPTVVYWSLFFRIFIPLQSIYLLGSIYFKNNQMFKTFFVTNIVQVFFLVLFILEMRLFLGVGDSIGKMGPEEGNRMLSIFCDIMKWAGCLLPLFFWVTSYFRLTEKQR
jgi:hypothetical protein